MKMFKATLEVSFPYESVDAPLALGAQIEAALTGGKTQIADTIVSGHAQADSITIALDTGIVNVRPKKAVETPPVEPLHDPNQTDLEDAVNAAGAADEGGEQLAG
ncbi:MAG: hypothetical protein P1U88_23245 [Thalassobaculaceae bacterium]|nr:hypothetical protein [Thalassobaculaceae bacterium]